MRTRGTGTRCLISGLIGMSIFLLYPVAPPRLVPHQGFTDTVSLYSQSYRVLQPPALADPYASMPSLHFGWDLLMGVAVVREARFWFVKALGLLMPVAMFAAIIVTANHFIVDALAGGTIVGFSIIAAKNLDQLDLRRELSALVPHGSLRSRGSEESRTSSAVAELPDIRISDRRRRAGLSTDMNLDEAPHPDINR
ncbi:MAG: phosphatase PAP2 family protein [Thermomicrobiales bacterium]